MKLKTKAKILLGALIVSGIVQQLSNFSPICASGEVSTASPTDSQEFLTPITMSEREKANELYLAVQRSDCNRIRELYRMPILIPKNGIQKGTLLYIMQYY